ncbi:hypothetical protein H0H81_007360 [Sphagnurus paluster]|uniref:Uncharacterized protein n=1 Tax=Sphagnurus paluster TaxID=117069 RepID=A0A9P7GKQ0_9AGAR|nr:hypothetical protein H0H81_007360 [Sphagnurus paluster]
MPAPQTTPRPADARPALGHVNLMVDTFIANANVEDLRSIVRSLLATNPPHFAGSFTTAARNRLRQTSARASVNPYTLFTPKSHSHPGSAAPTQHLHDVLARARALYGAGMGFTSLNVLASIVHASLGLRWEEDDDLADLFAIIDADIGQAIQAKEIDSGRVHDFNHARAIVDNLRDAIKASMSDVASWGGEFPFERASCSLNYWKI